ncbi:MAG: hypothetical protein QM820_46415 [Minicystis sp.]
MACSSGGGVRAWIALLGCVISACASGPTEARDAGAGGGSAEVRDAGPDADRVDAMSERCAEFCALFHCADRSLCDGAVPLDPGVPRTMQNTASGGHAECARSGSGVGGPSLYYRLTLPAARWSRVVATPITPTDPALVRAFADCDATEAEASARGGAITHGAAELCLRNDATTDRTVILAVSQYSGEQMDIPIVFDLSFEVLGADMGCPP